MSATGFPDSRDFYTEIQLGNIAGHSIIHKFGRNANIPNGSWSIISSSTPSGTFPVSGTTIRIKAGGNVGDIVGGAGARGITVVGINTNLIETNEVIVTSGSNVSLPTTTKFWRVYRAYVSSIGTYGVANIDDIIIENSDGTDDMIIISADEGQSQHAVYSIPSGKTGRLLSVHLTADANKAADFRLFTRNNFIDTQAPMSSKRLRLYWDGVLGYLPYSPVAPSLMLGALTDIWIEARGRGAGTEVSADFEILLVDDLSGPIRSM